MAPLTDDVPSPVPAQPRFDFPDPAAHPVPAFTAPAPVAQPVPVTQPAPTFAAPPPTVQLPDVQLPDVQSPVMQPPVMQPAPTPAQPQYSGPPGLGSFELERHPRASRAGSGPLDWVAFVLAFLAPPIGLLVGVGAAISGSRSRGFVAAIAKAAIGIGAGLSLILGVVFVVVGKIDSDQAAHNAIVASSRAYCTKLQSNPATLTSDTFGWPSPGDTVPDSIPAMKSYAATWKSLVALAPAGIQADTKKVEKAADGIIKSTQSTLTLDDASNIAVMQNAVAATKISTWVSTYCQ
jgi:hypothetical protein